MPPSAGSLARTVRQGATRGVRGGLGMAKAGGRTVWRRRVLARGVDDTAASASRRCLVVAPHPDDETIGCGATMARKRAAGTEVWVAVVTDGRHSHRSELIAPLRLAELRAAESRAVGQLLGIDESDVRFLGFEEHTLERCFDELVDVLGAVVDELRPDEVLVTSEHDWNPDHQVVHRAVRQALARRSFPGVVGAYPVWFWADGPWHTAPWESLGSELRQLPTDPLAARHLPTARLVSTAGFTELKRAAFALHASQTTNLTTEAGWQVFPERWIEPFLGPWELAFPVDLSAELVATPLAVAAKAGAEGAAPSPAGEPALTQLRDDFDDDRPAGSVVGTTSSGAARLGVDVEATIGIDDGELRLAPLRIPGFGRQGLAYGPFRRAPGLTLAVQALNSHNTAQSNVLPERRADRLRRVAAGLPRLRLGRPHVDDNLVVGFLPEPAPADARAGGNVFTMHAGSVVNGELRARVGDDSLRSFAGLQDLPLTYVVVLEERGATYYLSSVPGTDGAGSFPSMRPVATDHAADGTLVYAGLQQAVHAEVGHELSTRVSAVRTRLLPAWADGAPAGHLVADPLHGDGPLAGSSTPTGDLPWSVGGSGPRRSPMGMVPGTTDAVAQLTLPWPAGLVRVVLHTAARVHPDARAALVWRAGRAGAWRVSVWGDRAELAHTDQALGAADRDGDEPPTWDLVASGPTHLGAGAERSLQVVDDGRRFGVHLDGQLLFDGWFDDERGADQVGVGVGLGEAVGVTARAFRALPREVPVPPELDLQAAWCRRGAREVLVDAFTGPPGELNGRWCRTVGAGRMERTGDGAARVVAGLDRPNPGRSLYTVAWSEPEFADLEVEVTSPGTGRGGGHNGRGGLVLFQDPDNYVIVNVWLDDAPDHDGTAISMFFRTRGYERLYDSPWTNVDRRVTWGRPATLRIASDGAQVMTWVDGEPVLVRRLRDLYPGVPPLDINRVGLVANWEWGDDTGTCFRRFVARAD